MHSIVSTKEGLPTWSPLSTLLANFFIFATYWTKLNWKIRENFKYKYYGIYVDDILLIYNTSLDRSSEILKEFNPLLPELRKNILNFLLSSDIRSEGSIAIIKIFDDDFSFYITPRI